MGSAVNGHNFTSPRVPWGAPIWATQMRSATAAIRRAPASARRSRGSLRLLGGSSLGSRGSLFGLFLHGLALLAGDRLGRVIALLALCHPGLIKEARHAVGRLRALGHPGLDLLEIELHALGLLLGQQ